MLQKTLKVFKSAAVLPASGLGDALLMMIAAHQLQKKGCQATLYHPLFGELQDWFPGHLFKSSWPSSFNEDLVIAENDNSSRIRALKDNRKNGILPHLSIFYPTYLPSKHGPLAPLDKVFDSKKPMAENIAIAMTELLNHKELCKDNGLRPPATLIHRRFKDRIVLHPTSRELKKNWSQEKYLHLAETLEKKGLKPFFVLSPTERETWLDLRRAPLFNTLSEMAAHIYESGYMIGNDSVIGHLASNMNIPTLIIGECKEHLCLWRPDWQSGTILTPPFWIPRLLRKKNWQRFISEKHVLKCFSKLI